MTEAIRRTFLPFRATDPERDQNTLSEIFNSAKNDLSLAREGLFYIAQEFEKKNNRRPSILIPRYICRDIPDTLQQLNLSYSYYDVNSSLNFPVNLAEIIKSSKPDFVLAVNYFGFPCDLRLLSEACATVGSQIIEDNAHGFLSKDEEGRWLGSRAQWGMFSIRKTFPVIDGGVVTGSFSEKSPPLGKADSLHSQVKDFARYVAFLFPAIFVKILRSVRKQKHTKIRTKSNFELGSPSNFWQRLSDYDLHKNAQNRRVLFAELLSKASELELDPIFNELGKYVVPYGFPFRAKKDILAIESRLNEMGLEIFKWPDVHPESEKTLAVDLKNIWVVRFMW